MSNKTVTPFLSVITVVYNGASLIERTILSVLNQTFKQIEYIIIDGGSTDSTCEIIKKYDGRIHWISEKDRGIYDAMNKGIDLAQGKWINFMNCGDIFYSNDVVAALYAQQLNASVVYGDAIIQYEGFQAKFPIRPINEMWKHTPFCHQASFVRIDVMKRFKFDVTFKVGSDFDFFYQAYKSNVTFQYIPLVVCLFDGRAGTTNNFIFTAYREKKAIVLKYDYSLGKLLYYEILIGYVHLNYFIKKLLGGNRVASLRKMFKNRK